MNEVAQRKRSRFEGSGNSIPPHLLTDLDLEILKALFHDRFLSADYIAKLTGSNYRTWLLPRTADLLSDPYAYLKICDPQADKAKQALYMNIKRQFELTPLGYRVLLDRFGLTPPQRRPIRYIEHQIMADHAMASFRIGVKESDGRFELLTRDELLAHPRMPEKTRKLANPDVIPLGGTIKNDAGKSVAHIVRPDGHMFVLRDRTKNTSFFFPGFEIGTGNERHKAPHHDHSFTESKFEDYITVIEKEIYASHFGSPNFYIIFLEPYFNRLTHTMMPLLADMTRKNKWMRAHFLFGVQHTFTQEYKADGSRLTCDYYIVGDDGQPTTFNLVQ